jgi:hypothetical protein
MPKRLTLKHEEMFRLEAQRRIVSKGRKNRFTSRQLADLTGFSRHYVATLVSRMRREIEGNIVVSQKPTRRRAHMSPAEFEQIVAEAKGMM